MQTYRDYRPDRRFQPTIAISPDGTRVAYSDNLTGQYNLVVAAIDGTSDGVRMTGYTDATVRDTRWTPDGSEIIFAADANGDEFHQIRRIAAGGGEIRAITDAAKVQFQLGDVSPDGAWIAYSGNDREPTDQDVIVTHLATGEVRRPWADGGSLFATSWAPDSRRLLGLRHEGNTEMVIFLLDIEGGPAEQVLPAAGEDARYVVPGPWLPDGSGFLALTDIGREFVGLAYFDLADRELTWLATPEWDVEDVQLSHDGRVVVWRVNAGGVCEVHAAQLVGHELGNELPVAALPAGLIIAMSVDRSGTRLAALLATGSRPLNVFVAGIGPGAGEARRLTDTGRTVTSGTVEPTLITYPTHDGRRTPAWLYRPAGDGPFPVVVSIHGGPEAQERPSYNYGGLYQYLVAHGIAVVAPNVRGSNGYGRTYQRLILRDWGGGDLGDFEATAQYLRDADWVDSTRMGLFGGSYGGFATLTCLSRIPQYWACGVDIVGPSNLVTLATSVPPTWRARMADWVGDPETESEFLLSRSPITYADDIVAPLFVIQGANDPRVKKAESDGIVAALLARGVEVRYDVYEDEGHGFTRKENETKAFGDAADFLIEHLAV